MTNAARAQLKAFAPEVWLVEVPGTLDRVDVGLLDLQERARTFAFVREDNAARYAALRVAAKRIVASHLSLQTGEISIGRRACPRCGSAEHGPPVIIAPRALREVPALSLARSGGYGLVALASGSALGVDIEVVNPEFDYSDVARICCSDKEIEFLASQPSRESSSFYRCWVRKEAVTKAMGVGVVDSLVRLDVCLSQKSPVSVRSLAPSELWRVDDLPLPGPLVGSLARPVGDTSGVLLHHDLTGA